VFGGSSAAECCGTRVTPGFQRSVTVSVAVSLAVAAAIAVAVSVKTVSGKAVYAVAAGVCARQ